MSLPLLPSLPENYAEVRSARTRAVLAANTELVNLYLMIGRRICDGPGSSGLPLPSQSNSLLD